MRTLFFFVLFFVSSFFVFTQSAFAHFPATDGEIYAILHVDPNDSPIPTEQSNLYFLITFSNSKKTFYLNQCNCIVTISQEGKQIFQQQLIDKNNSKRSIWGASIPFVFPERDVYHITLSGRPLIGNTFKPFSVSWNFRVDEYPPVSPIALQTEQLHQQSDPTFIYFAIGFLSIIVFTGLGLFFVIRAPKNSN